MPPGYEFFPIIGLEVHVEPKTRSKMFCACSADYFGKEPNTHVCPICLGLPGSLPAPNKAAIEACIKLGLAFECRINLESKFDRKHYFYPDLPKGYQISQYDQPLCSDGIVSSDSKRLRIRRVHMEEDTAKMIHEGAYTLIDFNRSGVPLIEIVSEPQIRSAADARTFLEEIQRIIRYSGVSDADMEKGTMRCETNVSLQKTNSEGLPSYKVEIKNLNSFRSVERALIYEINRQSALLSHGEGVVQETRGWEESKLKTVSQRLKEEAQDYRYFPEPDIPQLTFTSDYIEKLKQALPELPQKAWERLLTTYQLAPYYAKLITESVEVKDFFEQVARSLAHLGRTWDTPKIGNEVARWITGELFRHLKSKKMSLGDVPFDARQFAELIALVRDGVTSELGAKRILAEMLGRAESPLTLLAKLGVELAADEKQYTEAIFQVIAKHARAVQDFKSGKLGALGFLLGHVQKEMQGRADPAKLRKLLEEALNSP